jgi:tRNA threonylcarbamoyladenosine biosynthesis protein TsaE
MIWQYSINTINDVAVQILHHLSGHKKFMLLGEMGAGKTTLISSFCKHLGVEEEVSSPTYAILQEYKGRQAGKEIMVAHTDWYRLQNEEELWNAGIVEYLQNEEYYCFVEWPNLLPAKFTAGFAALEITSLSDTERQISLV